MGQALERIRVSEKETETFDQLIKESLQNWNEKTQVKQRRGIELENYEKYLTAFQRSAGIDNETLEGLKEIQYCEETEEIIKSFAIKHTELSGSYGIIAMVKNQKKIDMMYAVFKFSVEIKPAWRFKPVGNIFGISIPIPAHELDFTSLDIDKLQENYIKNKALKAFQAEGMLTKINYFEEDEDV